MKNTHTAKKGGRDDAPNANKILVNLGDVSRMTGIGIGQVRAISKNDPTFPKPVPLGFQRKKLYKAADIVAWINGM